MNDLNLFLTYIFLCISLTYIILKIFENISRYALDNKNKIQKFHTTEAYRIGGFIIVFLILINSYFFEIFGSFPIFFIFFLPILLISSIEDLYQNTSVKLRLLAMSISSFLLVMHYEAHLSEVEISFVNTILSIKYISIIISTIGVVVTCNAWNFIDGLNGISSGLGSFVLFLFYIISGDSNLEGLKEFLLLASATTFGIFLINIKTGKVFLGDTGSYLIGLLIGWSGLMIVTYNKEVSPWSIFLIIIYPAIEITFTVIRRIMLKKSPWLPDNLHLHSLIYRVFEKKLNISKKIVNSLSGFFVLCLSIVPGLYYLSIDENFSKTIIAIFMYSIFYILLYFTFIFMLKFNNKIYN